MTGRSATKALIILALIAGSLLLYVIANVPGIHSRSVVDDALNTTNGFIAHRIAHAGGAINNVTYTNSYEALESNIKKGFLYFELDLSFTSDEKLVCLHDWGNSFQRSFGFTVVKAATLEEFETLVKEKSDFNKCTLDGLAAWMTNNPEAYIVTDLKGDNYKALKIIMEILPDAKRRVIPQIYSPENFQDIKRLGYKQIIWTLYRYGGTNEQVIGWVGEFYGPVSITMPVDRGITALPMELRNLGIPTYVHTINSVEQRDKYVNNFGVTEIYTDILDPIRY